MDSVMRVMRLGLTIASLCLSSAVLGQTVVTMPSPSGVLPPARLLNGRPYLQTGNGKFVPVLSAAGDKMTGGLISTAIGGGLNAAFSAQSSLPYFSWIYTPGAADSKNWQAGAGQNSWFLGVVNDANNAGSNAISIQRSGITITNIIVGPLQLGAESPTPDLIFGINQRSSLRSILNASDPNNAEGAIYLYTNSLAPSSGTNATGTYTLGIMNVVTVYSGGKTGLAANFVCQAASGTQVGCSGMEIDVYGGFNSAGSSYANASPKDGLLLNGSNGFTNSNALEILGGSATTAGNPLWDVGIRLGQNTPNRSTIASVAIWDQTYAPVGYQNSGVQNIAINLIGAYSARSISAPGMLVDGLGNEIAKSFTVGAVTPSSGTVGLGDFTDNSNGGTGFLDNGNHTNGYTQNGTLTTGINLAGAYYGPALFIQGVLNGNAIQVGSGGLFSVSNTGAVIGASLRSNSNALIVGSGQTAAITPSSSSTGGMIYLLDSNVQGGSGGTALFGFAAGYFAAIKGMATNATGPEGTLDFEFQTTSGGQFVSALNMSSRLIQANTQFALAASTPGAPPSGTGSGYACVDSTKKIYIKASCP